MNGGTGSGGGWVENEFTVKRQAKVPGDKKCWEAAAEPNGLRIAL